MPIMSSRAMHAAIDRWTGCIYEVHLSNTQQMMKQCPWTGEHYDSEVGFAGESMLHATIADPGIML